MKSWLLLFLLLGLGGLPGLGWLTSVREHNAAQAQGQAAAARGRAAEAAYFFGQAVALAATPLRNSLSGEPGLYPEA